MLVILRYPHIASRALLTYALHPCLYKLTVQMWQMLDLPIYFCLDQVWNHKKWNERISYSYGTHTATCEPNIWDRAYGTKILRVVGVWGHQRRWKWTTALSWCKCCLQACSTKCNWLPVKVWLHKRTGIKNLSLKITLVTEDFQDHIT